MAAYVRLRPAQEGRVVERNDQYRSYRRIGNIEIRKTTYVTTTVSGPENMSSGIVAHTNVRTLELGDGTRIDHPGDIAAFMDPESLTAKAYQKFEDELQAQTLRQNFGLGALFGGGAAIGGGVMMATQGSDSLEMPATYVAVGGALAILVGTIIMTHAHGAKAAVYHQRNEVLRYYPNDLLTRLNLCRAEQDGREIVFPCEAKISESTLH